jgi:MOSC domain-containing protein YiiM
LIVAEHDLDVESRFVIAAHRTGRIRSVNVGLPKPVEWRGRTWTTAIWKSPVIGQVQIRGVNLVGDGQADRSVHGGHDKAVYAYAAEDYDWWSEWLGRPTGPGHFGDNLTVEGLNLRQSVVGELWRLGTAVLQVTQPRLPCVKLAVRMQDPAFPRRFLEARLRVVEEGAVGAGDRVTVFDVPSTGMTLQQVVRPRASGGRHG